MNKGRLRPHCPQAEEVQVKLIRREQKKSFPPNALIVLNAGKPQGRAHELFLRQTQQSVLRRSAIGKKHASKVFVILIPEHDQEVTFKHAFVVTKIFKDCNLLANKEREKKTQASFYLTSSVLTSTVLRSISFPKESESTGDAVVDLKKIIIRNGIPIMLLSFA